MGIQMQFGSQSWVLLTLWMLHAVELVVGWVTTSESSLLYVFFLLFSFLIANYGYRLGEIYIVARSNESTIQSLAIALLPRMFSS